MMELLKCIPLYLVIVTMVAGRRRMRTEADIIDLTMQRVNHFKKNYKEGAIMCGKLAKESTDFRMEMLLGKTWRIYYIWYMDLQRHCLDMKFQKVTPSMVNRLHHEMSEHLKTEPNWNAASIMVKLARGKHSMVLFAYTGSPGVFQGVPNLVQDGELDWPILVPLLNFHVKLLHGGKYLLMADCQDGVTSLSADRKNIPYRADIADIARNLSLGPGSQACLSDKNRDEVWERK